MNGSRHAQRESCQGWGGAEQAPRRAGNLPGEWPCSQASEHWLQGPGHLALRVQDGGLLSHVAAWQLTRGQLELQCAVTQL